ncbi:sensor histidine kinase [Ferruginibacter albus]|uniref:sensor histidine kinase n=1 Tax=Ferruginibacter albus TaxID=2875540 RepID=UPI001CC630C0|nr:HAMP domain-containing sensor histidine kinase [Ferruginibacter albus]UAY53627.1 HAMP domain-containing histidine kinase [Ferruginibacter albus]
MKRKILQYIALTAVIAFYMFSCTTSINNKPAYTTTLLALDTKATLKQEEKYRYELLATASSMTDRNYAIHSELYRVISNTYVYSFHFDSSIYYAKIACTLANKANDKNLKVSQLQNLFRLYFLGSRLYRKEIDSLYNIMSVVDTNNLSPRTQALLMYSTGMYYINSERKQMALFYLRSAIKQYSMGTCTNEDSANIGNCYMLMGYVYSTMNYLYGTNTKATETEVKEGLTLIKESRNWIKNNVCALGLYYSGMALYSYSSPNREDIKRCYKDSLENLASTSGYNFNLYLMFAYNNLANVNFFSPGKNPSRYWGYQKEGAKYGKDLSDPIAGYQVKWLEGSLYLREGKFTKALPILKSVLPVRSFLNLKEQQFLLQGIRKCYEGIRNFDSILVYNKQALDISDSLIYLNMRDIASDAEDKYQNRIKQDEINTQNILLKYNQQQRTWLFSGIVILLSLVGLLIFFYHNIRKTARQLDKQNEELNKLNQQLEEANHTKSKLFAIVSHDLRSPISQLYHVLKLQEAKGATLTLQKRLEYDRQIQLGAANLLESMEALLTWSKTQMQSFTTVRSLVDVTTVITQCINLMKPLIVEKNLQIDNQIASDQLITIETDANFLLAILRNVLHNAIKASPENEFISISCNVSANSIVNYIQIKNRGKLFTQKDYQNILTVTQTSQQLWQGLGLQVVDELSRKINATVFFETIDKDVTCCTIIFNE